MTDRKKKKRERHLRNNADASHEAVLEVGRGLFQFYFCGRCFAATLIVNECHSILPAQGNTGSTHPPPPQILLIEDRVAAEGSPSGNRVATGHELSDVKTSPGCFVCKTAKKLASLSNSAAKWLAALNLNISPDLLGGINLFECK